MKGHCMVSIMRTLKSQTEAWGTAEWGMLKAPGFIPNTIHKRVKTEPGRDSTSNSRIWEAEAKGCLNSRTAWSTE